MDRNRGFTLIELLVSLFIIALLTGALLLGYKGTPKEFDLENVAQKLVSDIRKTQGYALALKEFNGGAPEPPRRWGFYIHYQGPGSDNTKYYIFADKDGDFQKDSSEVAEEITLQSAVVIGDAWTDQDPSLTELTITFTPPRPKICINCNSAGNSNDTEAYIRLTKDSLEKIIIITKSGEIKIQ